MSTIVGLRQATAMLHKQLDTGPFFSGLLANQVTLSDYRRLLAIFYTIYEPLENQLYARPDLLRLLPDLAQRRKSHLLIRDLDALAANRPSISDFSSLLIPCTSRYEAIGCLYVLEGATLGGRVVRKIIQRTLGLANDRGCAFLNSYGALIDARWCKFTSAIEALRTTSADLSAAKRGAVGTFKHFIHATETMELSYYDRKSGAVTCQLR